MDGYSSNCYKCLSQILALMCSQDDDDHLYEYVVEYFDKCVYYVTENVVCLPGISKDMYQKQTAKQVQAHYLSFFKCGQGNKAAMASYRRGENWTCS